MSEHWIVVYALFIGFFGGWIFGFKRSVPVINEQERDLVEKTIKLEQAESQVVSLRESVQSMGDLVERTADALKGFDTKLETERRKSRELFEVIESVLKERDQWKDMWFQHGREHLAAQNQMESAIEQLRTWLHSSLTTLNKYREDKGQGPVNFGIDPKAPPIGTAAVFEESLKKAEAEAPVGIDAIHLRDAIVGKYEANTRSSGE